MTRGALWTVAANGGDRLLGIVSVSILARLLTPGDFGLLGMGFAAISAVECLTAFGFDWTLVRQPNLDSRHLNTGWTLRIIVNLTAAVALVALARPAAAYFHEPRLTVVILVLAACKLIGGFENIGMVLYRRELRFDKEFQLLFMTRLVNLAVVIPVAYYYRSYLALLAGLLASRSAGVILSFVLQPFRPRLSLVAHRDLLSFSVWLQLNNLLLTIRERAPDFVLGRAIGAPAVAIFSMSGEIANLAVSELVAPINRAVFSGYSTFSNDVERLRDAYLSLASLIWLVCLPIATGIACTAPQIIMLFLGSQWLEGIPVLQLLAIGSLASVVMANAHMIFMTIGRPAISTRLALVSVLILVPTVVVLTRLDGVRGAALGCALSTAAMVPLVFWWLRSSIQLRIAQLGVRAWRPFVATAVMGTVVHAISPEQPDAEFLPNVMELVRLVCIGAAVFAATVYATWRVSGRPAGAETQLVELARSMLRRSR